MSNKEFLSEEECQIRKDAHLDRTIKELGWEEIPQTEYQRIKRDDPKNCNSYTMRWRFRYFKLKPKLTEFEEHLILYLNEFPESFERICKELENE